MRNKTIVLAGLSIIAVFILAFYCKFSEGFDSRYFTGLKLSWTIPIIFLIVFGMTFVKTRQLENNAEINGGIITQDLISPLIEEAIFTVIPFIFIDKSDYIIFIFVKSIFFTSAHITKNISWLSHLQLFFLSVITGFSLLITQNVFLPILFHIFYNFTITLRGAFYAKKSFNK